MTDAKVLSIITEVIKDFSWNDIKYIYNFNYHLAQNEYFEDIFNLDIGFIVFAKSGEQYKLMIRFSGVQGVSLYTGGRLIQLCLFEILDVKDDRWCEARYWVRDYESDNLKFYCYEIRFISIERSDIKVP